MKKKWAIKFLWQKQEVTLVKTVPELPGINIYRVATRQGKVREIEFFSRSGNCQGIL